MLTSYCAMQRPPDLLGSQRSVDMAYADWAEGVHDGVGYGHGSGHRRQFPDAFHTQGIGRRERLHRLQDEMGYGRGLWDGIVQQTAGQRLTLWRVDDALGQGLPEALHDAAIHLPFDELWVDDAAAIMHSHVLEKGHFSRLLVHLYNCHMCTKGVRVAGERVRAAEVQPNAEVRRQQGFIVGRGGECSEGHHLPWVATIADMPALEDEMLG